MSSDPSRFDVIVLGAGPAGETVASRLAGHGLQIALVERELIGGECAYWACIPSKTLLRAPEVGSEGRRAAGVIEPQLRFDDLAEYRDFMIRGLDDSGEQREYEEQGTAVFRGEGRVAGPGRVQVGDRTLAGERIVLATGSDAQIPDIEGLRESGYWTNREATTITEVPESAVVLGGGPVGIELSQLLRGLGAKVTLIEAAPRLLEREAPRVGELIAHALSDDGIEVYCDASVRSVSGGDDERVLALDGGDEARGERLIVATGRVPRTARLGLETVGIGADGGAVQVDERCRAAEGVWAVGDVTGVMPFTHVGMYQGRIVVADILGQPAKADYRAVPRVVFSDPEIAAVGLTEAQAREARVATDEASVKLSATTRSWTYERDPRGELSVLVDRERSVLVGAWAVGPLASEWIHYAALAIKAQVPVAVLKDTVAQFPTYTEAYLKALEQL